MKFDEIWDYVTQGSPQNAERFIRVPTRLVTALRDIRDLQLSGEVLIRQLEALRITYLGNIG